MQAIFSSLGSNYTAQYCRSALRQLFSPDKKARAQLERQLLDYCAGSSVRLLYKGREAIECAVRVLLPPKAIVLTQAFSCYAVEQGIARADARAAYVDIDLGTNLSVATLQKGLKKHPHATAVLIQHSLGIPANIQAIAQWAHEHQLLVIEDLAQAVGGVDENGVKLGTYGDVVIFSFGRDKIIDGVSGGAVVFKQLTKEQKKALDSLVVAELSSIQRIKDLLYPSLTYVIRFSHGFFIDKILFILGRMTGILQSPARAVTTTMTELPASHAHLAVQQFQQLDVLVAHRKTIAGIYLNNLPSELHAWAYPKKSESGGTSLRFCIQTTHCQELIESLRSSHIYVTDRWYRRAVDGMTMGQKTTYQQGSCPKAETLAKTIVTLPTHRNMTLSLTKKLAVTINNYLKTHIS